MVSHKNHNLKVNEGFVIFLTSKLIACFIDSFTSKMKSQSFAYLFNVGEHIYWILDLEDEVHSIWVIWTSGLQECKSSLYFSKWGVVGRERSLGWSMLGVVAHNRPLKLAPMYPACLEKASSMGFIQICYGVLHEMKLIF